MDLVIITTTTDFIEIDYRECELYRKGRMFGKVRISDISDLFNTDDGVLFTANNEQYLFTFAHVDDIDGDTSITSNQIIFDKLDAVII